MTNKWKYGFLYLGRLTEAFKPEAARKWAFVPLAKHKNSFSFLNNWSLTHFQREFLYKLQGMYKFSRRIKKF